MENLIIAGVLLFAFLISALNGNRSNFSKILLFASGFGLLNLAQERLNFIGKMGMILPIALLVILSFSLDFLMNSRLSKILLGGMIYAYICYSVIPMLIAALNGRQDNFLLVASVAIYSLVMMLISRNYSKFSEEKAESQAESEEYNIDELFAERQKPAEEAE